MMKESGCCRWHNAIGLLAIGLVACSLPAYGAMGPITDNGQASADVQRQSQSAEQSAEQSKEFLAWTGAKVDYLVGDGLRDTGVCTPPVGLNEPVPCSVPADCAFLAQGDPNFVASCTGGFCDYPAAQACTTNADCSTNGSFPPDVNNDFAKYHSTGHCQGGFCENQNFHQCRDAGHRNEGEWHLPLNPISGDPQGCGVLEDNFNGGCNATAGAAFDTIECGETVCGTATVRAFSGSTLRDTDWYELVVTQNTFVTLNATAEFEMVMGFARNHGDGNCANSDGYFWGGHYVVTANACDHATATACIGPGTWWVIVVPVFAQGTIPCLDWELTVECETPCSIGCCIGNDVCTDVDEDTCQFALAGSNAGDNCIVADCVWGCPGANAACGSSTNIDNTVNSNTANPPMSCATGTSIGLFWFWFTATGDSVEVTTCNSIPALGGDSSFALYSGDCTNTLNEVACSEDEGCTGGGPWLGTIEFCNMVPGDTYYIQFASWAAVAQGDYVLDVTCPAPACAPAACCLSDGSCITASPTDCANADAGHGGEYGGAGTTCLGDTDTNGIDDQCELGACCTPPDGDCAPLPESVCTAIGGLDFIFGGRCAPVDPCQGACCKFTAFPPPGTWTCTEKPEATCISATWYAGEFCGGPGGNPPWFSCPEENLVCSVYPDANDDNCQQPAVEEGVQGVTGAVSDANNDDDPLGPGATRAADDFLPLASGITQVCWWGHYQDIDTSGGSPGAPEPADACTKSTDDFVVTYYTDNGGCPGTLVATFSQAAANLTVLRTSEGHRDPNGHLVYEYQGTHSSVAVTPGNCYWLEIVNDTGVDDCLWVWAPSPMFLDNGTPNGNGYSVQEDGLPATGGYDCTPNCPACSSLNRMDLAWCLNIPVGICDHCPDPCTGDPEGEPVCTDGYTDTYNVGCNAETQAGEVFTPIDICQNICGTYGTFTSPIECTTNSDCAVPEICSNGFCTGDPSPHRDTDWYKITIPPPTSLFVEWCVTGEYPTLMGIINTGGNDNCPINPFWAALGVNPACIGTCEGSTLAVGTWYGYVATSSITDTLPCGGAYDLTLNHASCSTPTPCVCLDVRSLKDHTGTANAPLTMGCSNGIEPRFGGITKLEIDVDDASDFGSVSSVICSTSGDVTARVSGASAAGNTVTVTFSPALPNKEACTITLDCGAVVCVRGLEGDSNRNGTTNPVDSNEQLLRYGQTAAVAGYQWDPNKDGVVNPVDSNETLLRFGTSVPACP